MNRTEVVKIGSGYFHSSQVQPQLAVKLVKQPVVQLLPPIFNVLFSVCWQQDIKDTAAKQDVARWQVCFLTNPAGCRFSEQNEQKRTTAKSLSRSPVSLSFGSCDSVKPTLNSCHIPANQEAQRLLSNWVAPQKRLKLGISKSAEQVQKLRESVWR